jgi:hypothetical protein
MTQDIDIGTIEQALIDKLYDNVTIRRYTNFIKKGDYDMPSLNGIDLWVHGRIPVESENNRILFGSVYEVPIDITLLCRFRNRDKLTETVNDLCSEITRVIYKSGKIASTNGYRLPINVVEDAIGDTDNPETYIITITITYEMILIPA